MHFRDITAGFGEPRANNNCHGETKRNRATSIGSQVAVYPLCTSVQGTWGFSPFCLDEGSLTYAFSTPPIVRSQRPYQILLDSTVFTANYFLNGVKSSVTCLIKPRVVIIQTDASLCAIALRCHRHL